MIRKFTKFISILSLIAILLSSSVIGASGAQIGSSSLPTGSYSLSTYRQGATADDPDCPKAEATASAATTSDYKDLKVYVGGMPFGVKFLTDGVIVSGFCDTDLIKPENNPAKLAGLRSNDIISEVNGKALKSVSELEETVSKGVPFSIKYSRCGKEATAKLSPIYLKEQGRYSIGLSVRDSGAGIGTVTFICPKTGAFGGLGHGICDAGSGELIPMQRGSVVNVKINGIIKGLSGAPGEVKGCLSSGKNGTLLTNTHCGVFGIFAELPSAIHGKPVSIGTRNTVKDGKAYIYTMLDGDKVEKYEIEISNIQRNSTTNKCFTVKITDKRLINKTGGIIQGMSGSPIMQNGKIIGAVTHVLINDPTCGYGIFIENMLNQMGDLAG